MLSYQVLECNVSKLITMHLPVFSDCVQLVELLMHMAHLRLDRRCLVDLCMNPRSAGMDNVLGLLIK